MTSSTEPFDGEPRTPDEGQSPGGDPHTSAGAAESPGGDPHTSAGAAESPGGDPHTSAGAAESPGGDPHTSAGAAETPGGDPHTSAGAAESPGGDPHTSAGAAETPDGASHTSAGDPQTSTDAQRTGLGLRQRVGIAIVLVLVALVGLAAGAGVSPGDIRESIEQRLYGDPEADVDRARVVAADSSGDHTIEVLLAPTDRGSGECVLVEATGPDWASSDDDGSTTWCWLEGPATPWSESGFQLIRPGDRFGLLIEVPLGPIGAGSGAVALVGLVYDDVKAIRAEFGDGGEYTFNLVTDNGWFAVILPGGVVDIDRVDGGLVNGVVALEMVDLDGRVLATATPNSNWF